MSVESGCPRENVRPLATAVDLICSDRPKAERDICNVSYLAKASEMRWPSSLYTKSVNDALANDAVRELFVNDATYFRRGKKLLIE